MVRARVIFYLVFILLTLAGCNHKVEQPNPCSSQQDSQGVWQCVTTCRWSSDPGLNTCPTVEPSMQVGRQPAPSPEG